MKDGLFCKAHAWSLFSEFRNCERWLLYTGEPPSKTRDCVFSVPETEDCSMGSEQLGALELYLPYQIKIIQARNGDNSNSDCPHCKTISSFPGSVRDQPSQLCPRQKLGMVWVTPLPRSLPQWQWGWDQTRCLTLPLSSFESPASSAFP